MERGAKGRVATRPGARSLVAMPTVASRYAAPTRAANGTPKKYRVVVVRWDDRILVWKDPPAHSLWGVSNHRVSATTTSRPQNAASFARGYYLIDKDLNTLLSDFQA